MSEPPLGIIAVFETPAAMREAALRLREVGLRAVEAYTPYPVEGLEAVTPRGSPVLLPLLIAAGAVIGAFCGYMIQYWDEVVGYPLNVGGRPYNSWPAFIVATFEIMLLMAVTAGFFGLLAKSRLPQLYHPIFEAKAFERASRDRFVICLEATDPAFDAAAVRRVFEELGADEIEEVRA